jgi:hypothetical protein
MSRPDGPVDVRDRRAGSLAKPGAPSRLAIPATATASNSRRWVTTTSCRRATWRVADRKSQEAAPSMPLQ